MASTLCKTFSTYVTVFYIRITLTAITDGPDVRLRDDIPLQNAYEIASPVVWMVHDDDHVRSRSRLHDHARDHDVHDVHGDARGHHPQLSRDPCS